MYIGLGGLLILILILWLLGVIWRVAREAFAQRSCPIRSTGACGSKGFSIRGTTLRWSSGACLLARRKSRAAAFNARAIIGDEYSSSVPL